MNKLFILSGVSGSGKSSIVDILSTNQIVSFTTRPKRQGEEHGVDYIFITVDEFYYLLNNNGLIEHTEYSGNYYGITRNELETKMAKGNAFFVSDYHGMKQLKELYPNCVTIYMYVSKEDAEKQMKMRGDKEEQIEKRLSTYLEEVMHCIYYDHIVVNHHGEMDETINKIKDIIGGIN